VVQERPADASTCSKPRPQTKEDGDMIGVRGAPKGVSGGRQGDSARCRPKEARKQ
jgi:hypothetical protein